jgi:hypothetical protein
MQVRALLNGFHGFAIFVQIKLQRVPGGLHGNWPHAKEQNKCRQIITKKQSFGHYLAF